MRTIRLSLEGTDAGAHNAVMINGINITFNQRQSTPVKFTYNWTKVSPGISPEIIRPFSKVPS